MKFQEFLSYLEHNVNKDSILFIDGVKKKFKAMVKFTSINYAGEPYIKISFEDLSYLLILIGEEELYFSSDFHIETGIPNSLIGEKEIEYKNRRFQLENKDDYQYILHFYFGKLEDVEGEARFCDYFPVSGKKSFLSLGWSARTGKRIDMNPELIDLSKISLPKENQ